MKIILYIAATLDGFIARKNGDIDWLKPFENSKEDYGYKKFYKSIDGLLIGRKTYMQVLTFGEYPYKEKPVYVFSKNKNIRGENNTKIINENVKDTMKALKRKHNKMWLVGGSNLIKQFMLENLIDEFIISIIPITLGNGIPLFEKQKNTTALRLKSIKSYKSGIVQLHYTKL